MLAAAAKETTQVPLWLQLLLVTLTPIIGLIGVLYGGRISQSNEQKKWVRDERLRAYVEFISSAVALHRVAIDMAVQMKSENRETRKKAAQTYSTEYGNFLELWTRVGLVASDRFRTSAGIVVNEMGETTKFVIESFESGMDEEMRKRSDSLTRSRTRKIDDLRALAAMDLGIKN